MAMRLDGICDGVTVRPKRWRIVARLCFGMESSELIDTSSIVSRLTPRSGHACERGHPG